MKAEKLLAALVVELNLLREEVVHPKGVKTQAAALDEFCLVSKNIAHIHGKMKFDLGLWRQNVFANSPDGQDKVGEILEDTLIIMDNFYRHPRPEPPTSFVPV